MQKTQNPAAIIANTCAKKININACLETEPDTQRWRISANTNAAPINAHTAGTYFKVKITKLYLESLPSKKRAANDTIIKAKKENIINI